MIFGGFSMPVFLIFITCSKVRYYYCSCGFFVLVVQPSTAISTVINNFSWPVGKNVAPHPVPSNVKTAPAGRRNNKISKLKGEENTNGHERGPVKILRYLTYTTIVVTASACHFLDLYKKCSWIQYCQYLLLYFNFLSSIKYSTIDILSAVTLFNGPWLLVSSCTLTLQYFCFYITFKSFLGRQVGTMATFQMQKGMDKRQIGTQSICL